MTKPKRLKNESIDAYNERASKLYYSNGYHINEIAKKLKIDKIEVFNYVTNTYKITTASEREEMISLFNKGYSYSAIAKIFNKSRACVKDRIERPATINYKRSVDLTDKQIDKIKKMAKDGKTIREIAKEIGINEKSVEYRLSHTDAEIHKKYKYVSPAEVNQYIKLYKKGKSHYEIAEICGRSRTTVSRHLHAKGYWRSKEK